MTTSHAHARRTTNAIAWTLNNYTQADIDSIKDYISLEADFGCFSEELGENGTPHLQGYHHYKRQRSYPCKAFEAICNKRFHCEVAKGSALQNRNYCLGMVAKKGNTPNKTYWEHGELPQQGRRTDWSEARDMLKSGSVADVIEAQPHLLPCINALKQFRAMTRKSTHRDVRVVALIGATRTGKSRSAWAAYPDLFSKPAGFYWGSYADQKTILLDDFTGDLPIAELLKVLDRYPLELPVKGTYTPALYENVIITSNLEPRQWYPFALPEQLDALEARMRVISWKTTFTVEDITSHTHANHEEIDVSQEARGEGSREPTPIP